ncbi:MAG: heparinase II/III-family protein [Chloroflexi bacterium]|nr:heparinase II/III-family protein [Chloroflexota bacterium]
MATFTLHITRPDGRIPQFGDTDSGRLFKLHPAYQKMTVAAAKKTYLHLADYAALPDDAAYYDEDILDHRPLVAAANGLFPRADFRAFAGDCLDEYIVAGLARSAPPASSEGALMRADRLALQTPSAHFSDSQADKEITPPADAQSTRLQFPGARSLRAGLRLHAYPDFGLYIFRSPRLYLAVRCGSLGQRGNGGHAHSDQLSIELWVDDQPQIVDPGTYIYTPLPAQRNRYRSAAVHFAPRFAAEPADLSLLFRMPDVFRAQCLYAGVAGFAGTHSAYGTPITRLIRILDDALEIYDTPGTHTQPAAVPHSNGYGKLLAKHAPSAARE